MIWATCVVEDVSRNLDILTLEFWAIWGRPPIVPECKQIRRQPLVRHSLIIQQWHPLLLRRSCMTEMSLVQWIRRGLRSRLYDVSSKYDVHQCSKVNFLLFFQNKVLFALNFLPSARPESLRASSIPLSTAAVASGILIAWDMGTKSCTKLKWVIELYPLPAMWPSWFFRHVWLHSLPCGSMSFHYTSVLRFGNLAGCFKPRFGYP